MLMTIPTKNSALPTNCCVPNVREYRCKNSLIMFLQKQIAVNELYPSEVAQHDEEYSGIKDVLEHRFTSNKKRRTDLEFKILWEGDKEPNWYSWNSTFGHAEKIHDYLMTHNLKNTFLPNTLGRKDMYLLNVTQGLYSKLNAQRVSGYFAPHNL